MHKWHFNFQLFYFLTILASAFTHSSLSIIHRDSHSISARCINFQNLRSSVYILFCNLLHQRTPTLPDQCKLFLDERVGGGGGGKGGRKEIIFQLKIKNLRAVYCKNQNIAKKIIAIASAALHLASRVFLVT